MVVIRFGDGASPVHNQGISVFVGNARSADVHVARRTAGPHLKADFCKVGLSEKHLNTAELLDSEIVVLVIGVNNTVECFNGGKGLNGFICTAKVGANLFTHLTQVSSGIFLRGIERRFKIGTYFNQHGIDLGKMCLLLSVNFIHEVSLRARCGTALQCCVFDATAELVNTKTGFR